MANLLEKIQLSNELYRAKMSPSNSIASTSNNILFSCFSQGTDSDYYIIKVLRSDDGGITWVDKNFPIVGATDHNTPSMVIDSGNVIHVLFSSCMSASGGSLRIYYVYSTNGGETWSVPTILQPLTGYDQISPKILIDKKNNILHAVWVGTDSSNSKTQIKHCRSMDGGANWSYFKNVATIANYNQTTPSATVDLNGGLYIFWAGCDNTNTSYQQIKYTKSIDFGNSWLDWKNVNLESNYNQYNPYTEIANNTVYVSWDGQDSSHSTKQIKLCSSTNGGAIWSSIITITDEIYNQVNPKLVWHNNCLNIFWRSFSDTTINPRIKYTRTSDGVTFLSSSFLTPGYDNISEFAVMTYKNYLIYNYETNLSILVKKYGYRKYLIQDGNDIKKSVVNIAETPINITKSISADSKTYQMDSSINKGSLLIFDINKLIASNLYGVNATTGDVTFSSVRSGNILFTYTAIDSSGVATPNTQKVVSPELDNKTYKLGTKVTAGTVIAVENSPILIDPSNYSVNYLKGEIIFTASKTNDVQFQYLPVTRSWEKIGQTPVTSDMFKLHGHDEITWLTFDEFKKLDVDQPYILFNDNGMEYTRPGISIKGDALSKYRYQVTMDGKHEPLKKWSEYIAGNKSDSVNISASMLTDSEPKNVYITVEQQDDKLITTRRGSVALNNNAPDILAQINGTRLDLTVSDKDGDMICYNIYANGKKVYPIGKEYTPLLVTPNKFTYIFQTDEINIDDNNIVIINAKDQFGKKSMVRLDFTGIYVGLIFVDDKGNRYSTDKGEALQILDMGTVQAGNDSSVYKVRLSNQNGFDVKNIEVWEEGNIINGKLRFSKTLYPFVGNDTLTFEEILVNGRFLEFYVKIESEESIVPGGGNFKILSKAQIASESGEDIQIPAPDPNSIVKFVIKDNNGNNLNNAIVKFNSNAIEKSNVYGEAIFKNVSINGEMQYEIMADGYITISGTTIVDESDKTYIVNVELIPIAKHKVTFTIKSDTTPIINSKVIINEKKIQFGNSIITIPRIELYTDINGIATIDLAEGEYTYTITNSGYVDLNNVMTVGLSDLSINQNLTVAYKVQLKITNGIDPVEYSVVTINNMSMVADYDGNIITKLPAGNYNYTVAAAGYNTFTGNIAITNSNILQQINLIKK